MVTPVCEVSPVYTSDVAPQSRDWKASSIKVVSVSSFEGSGHWCSNLTLLLGKQHASTILRQMSTAVL